MPVFFKVCGGHHLFSEKRKLRSFQVNLKAEGGKEGRRKGRFHGGI